MKNNWIKNFNALALSPNRRTILEIINIGLGAIDTEKVMRDSILLEGDVLKIKNQSFDLTQFKKIKVVGCGKAAPRAAFALEDILGDKISEGAVIGLEKVATKIIRSFVGTHPKPSEENREAGKRIYEMAEDANEDDLVIVIVSGGGSSLLCYPESEYKQGAVLYENFLKSGQTIVEINTVRKHLSALKGGGLAKVAYPATVVGLIFSDIPGDKFADVASGPTYKDITAIEDAKKIILENNLGEYELLETPKEDKYFEKVENFVLVSGTTALTAMAASARELGLEADVISEPLYDEVVPALEKIFARKKNGRAVLASGEPRLKVRAGAGEGGRNLHMSLEALKMITGDSVFASFASDGLDNSDAAGGIADLLTLQKMKDKKISPEDYLNRFDSYHAFLKSGDLILTGPTGANVSDLMILLANK